MKPLSKEYLLLFNTITRTEEALKDLRRDLMAAQQQAEELFLAEEEPPDVAAGGEIPRDNAG